MKTHPRYYIQLALAFNALVLNLSAIQQLNSGSFTDASPMTTARFLHTATLLANGMVLVAGGEDSSFNAITSAELYHPATGTCMALDFAGFLAPIGGADATGGSFADPLRTFNLKSTIPVKFTAACNGSPVTTGIHTLQATKWSNETTADAPLGATPTDAATTGNQFRLTDAEWHFNLDTKATAMSAGKWQLFATLSDGSQHSAWIQLK